MNIPIWIIAGAVLGWAACSMLNAGNTRSIGVSILIGAVGGFFGGNVLAPMLGAPTDKLNEFSAFSLIVAMGAAAGCLVVGNLLHRRSASDAPPGEP